MVRQAEATRAYDERIENTLLQLPSSHLDPAKPCYAQPNTGGPSTSGPGFQSGTGA